MHVALFVGNYGIGMSCCIVEEMLNARLELMPLCCRECCGHRADRMKHGGIEDTGIEKKNSEYLLAVFNLGWIEVAFLHDFGPLDFSSIVWGGTGLWGMLIVVGYFMKETDKCAFDVAGEG